MVRVKACVDTGVGGGTEHWLRCCAGTSSPLCSSLEESGDLGRLRGQSLCHCRWTG